MKKLSYLIVLALILGLVLTGCSLLSNIGQAPANDQSGITYLMKATEDVPDSFPLYAGQDWEVGEVLVWDNGLELCVKYRLFDGTGEDLVDVVGDGWLLYETHLAVGKELSDIPQTKKNNPIPGQFLYGNDKLEGEKAWEICIPFDELWGKTLFIAAHAVIKKTECETISGVITPELNWSRSAEDSVVAVTGYGASWDPAVQLLMATPLTAENEVWDGGTIGQYFTGYSTRFDVQWASWPLINTGSTDLRLLKATFDLDANVAANITSAVLRMPDFSPDAIPINDNVYIFLNSSLQFWGGTGVVGAAGTLTTFEGMDGVPAIPTYEEPDWGGLDLTGWYITGEFPDLNIAEFVPGANALDVFTEENNTGGGIAKLELVLGYEYQQECTTTESETAWAGTEIGEIPFAGANWATYFEYTVQPPVVAPVVSVTDTWSVVDTDSLNGESANLGGGLQQFEWFAKTRINNSNFEMAIGTDDAAPAGMDTAETVWVSEQQESFTLSYDGSGNAVLSVVNHPTVNFVVGAGTFGRIGINVKAKSSDGRTTSISDLVFSLGSLSINNVSVTNAMKSLTISGVDMSSAWTLTGNFTFTWDTIGASEDQAVVFSID